MSPEATSLRQLGDETDQRLRDAKDAGDWPTGEPVSLLKMATATQLHPTTDLLGHVPRIASFFRFARGARSMNFRVEFPDFFNVGQ